MQQVLRMFKKRSNQIIEKFAHLGILKKSIGANFFGQESIGYKQVRGNGVLLLTNEELIFEYWIPKKCLRIPISKIYELEITKWHLKKTKGVDLLKVKFINNEDMNDSAAWWLNDLDTWVRELKILIIKK